MTLARLAVVVLSIGMISAVGQEQPSRSHTPRDNNTRTANASAIPAESRTGADAQDLLRDISNGQRQIKLGARGSALLADRGDGGKYLAIPMRSDDIELPGDEICYNIRSYVVARDSRDSDATHPVKSSTCQLASRYRVKTIAPTEVAPGDEPQR